MEIAPLKERREDIPAMISYYLREATSVLTGQAQERSEYRIEEDAVALLCECDYSGNIRACGFDL